MRSRTRECMGTRVASADVRVAPAPAIAQLSVSIEYLLKCPPRTPLAQHRATP
jgi:hypothetical protein